MPLLAAPLPEACAPSYGDGPPTDTPNSIGDIYVDTSTGTVYVSIGTDSPADWVTLGGDTSTVNTVAATGATETISFATATDEIVHDLTMDQNCTISFDSAPAAGRVGRMTLILRGAFTPTLPASVDWPDGTPPTYGSPSVFEFFTVDGGTTVFGFLAGATMS